MLYRRRRTKSLWEHCLRRRGQFAYDADCHKYVNCWDGQAFLQGHNSIALLNILHWILVRQDTLQNQIKESKMIQQ